MASLDRYILDAEGNPVLEPDLFVWGQWFRDNNLSRRVAREQVGDADVSTVFLGTDMNFGQGPPVLFETMIFGGEHDCYCKRWETRSEAMAGHAAIVEKLKRKEGL